MIGSWMPTWHKRSQSGQPPPSTAWKRCPPCHWPQRREGGSWLLEGTQFVDSLTARYDGRGGKASSLSHCIQLVLPTPGLFSYRVTEFCTHTHTHTHTQARAFTCATTILFFFSLGHFELDFSSLITDLSNHLLEPLMNLKRQALDAGRQGKWP